MADVEKKRKSVSFTPGAVVVDGEGAGGEEANGEQNGAADPAVDEVNVCRLYLSCCAPLTVD